MDIAEGEVSSPPAVDSDVADRDRVVEIYVNGEKISTPLEINSSLLGN